MRAPAAYHTGKIIVADDQPCHLNPVEAVLVQAGYDVVTAINGREVLDKAAVFCPDLFLLDVNMPELDGFETCACLKDDPGFHDVPVLFMSAQDDMQAVECAFELGGADFLSKPFNRVEMLVRIRAHLRAYHVRKRHLHQVLEEARQIADIASLCVGLAKNLRGQHHAGGGEDADRVAVPEVAGCLSSHADTLIQDIERLLGKDNAGFLRELHLREYKQDTGASDVIAFLGGAYLRAKRRGISLTMPRRPGDFKLRAAPFDIKKLIDEATDLFLEHLPRGTACHVATSQRAPGEICLHFTSDLPPEEGDAVVESEPWRGIQPKDDLARLAAGLGAEIDLRMRDRRPPEMKISMPATVL